MMTTTPLEISRPIKRLVERVVPGGSAIYLPVTPEPGAVVNECFPNVETKIERAGGQMLCGWQLWEWPHVLVEAEFHAVWMSPAGDLVEITPKPQQESKILFVPDPKLRYQRLSKDNVRLALRDDLVIRHFIRASEMIVRVMNKGERSSQYGYVSVPAHELEPLQEARDFLGASLASGLRDHDACLCRSGNKYKRCHGRAWSVSLGT